MLDEVIARRGGPQAIRCDNGPELTCRHFLAWGLEWKIELRHIQPGRPMQNGHVESFHGRLREECLRASWFSNLLDARTKIANWRKEYNEVRPHSSLDYRTPNEFARACRQQQVYLEQPVNVSIFAAPHSRTLIPHRFPHGNFRFLYSSLGGVECQLPPHASAWRLTCDRFSGKPSALTRRASPAISRRSACCSVGIFSSTSSDT